MKKSERLGSISPPTANLIGKLTAAIRQGSQDRQEILAILDEVAAVNEPCAIRGLMSFGLAPDEQVRTRTRLIIKRLFNQIPLEALPELDDSLRQSWGHIQDWYGIRPEAIRGMPTRTASDQTYLGLVASHRSGYLREAALQALSLEATDDTLPFILLRLRDWVPEVRSAAAKALRIWLVPYQADTIVRCLGLIDRLSSHPRFRRESLNDVENLLRDGRCANAVRRGLASRTRAIRRFCYRIAIWNPAFVAEEVVQQGVRDTDVIVRKWAFDAAERMFPSGSNELRERAAVDLFGPIRRRAFELIAKHPSCSFSAMQRFLFDRSAVIRRECQRIVSARGWVDPAQFYRGIARGGASRNLEVSLIGLAETGTAKDDEFVLPLLANPRARVRRTAIRAMRLLSANQPVTTLLQLVAEDVPSVADEAARTLLSLRLVPAQSVWAAALNNNEARVRRGLLKLFARTSKWQQLPICLQAAADSDPDVSERATVMLCRWVDRSNRSFVPPSSTETERSRELLANVRNPLAPRLIRDLDFILRTAAT